MTAKNTNNTFHQGFYRVLSTTFDPALRYYFPEGTLLIVSDMFHGPAKDRPADARFVDARPANALPTYGLTVKVAYAGNVNGRDSAPRIYNADAAFSSRNIAGTSSDKVIATILANCEFVDTNTIPLDVQIGVAATESSIQILKRLIAMGHGDTVEQVLVEIQHEKGWLAS